MKFIHLSDLHIGKRVNEVSMLEDQQYILSSVIRIVDEEKPEAVLIAGDVFDKRRHFSQHLPPGQTEQKTVAGKGRQLGVGGHICIAVHQIIAQQPVGAVVFPDLLPAAIVHSILHGIAHGQPQQTAPVCGSVQSHCAASFLKIVEWIPSL